jgi:phosphoenolpyruvate---glycerone phosphotransferase subunit DhaL
MNKTITFDLIKNALIEATDELEKNRQYFNDLDSPIGDSDHGDSVCSSFKKVREAVLGYDDTEIKDTGALLKAAGQALIFSGGAAMGPLYGSAFSEAGKIVAGKSEISYDDFVKMWVAFAGGIGKRGEKVGEKTMYDTIRPAVDALEKAFAEGKSLKEACVLVDIAAKDGMNATKDMLALRGRSSRLGERSLGHIDPGAASMYTIISTFFKTVGEL